MKRYEMSSKTCLIRRCPVILRADGRAFHSLTRGMKKPFDPNMYEPMLASASSMVSSLQGKFAYFQSDEISILLIDYNTLNQSAMFDYDVQKLCSVGASAATYGFMKIYDGNKIVNFDCRAFNVPIEDVNNYFIWRQRDAVRNSIQGYGQKIIGRKKIHGMKNDEVVERMLLEYEFDWHVEAMYPRGTIVYPNDCKLDAPSFSDDHGFIENFIKPKED